MSLKTRSLGSVEAYLERAVGHMYPMTTPNYSISWSGCGTSAIQMNRSS